MASVSTGAVLRQFRALFAGGTVAGLSDGQLLERFLTGRGEVAEVAFAALLARHGPMVLGVCRRALPDPADAEDAFQATFLVLVRKGGSVRVDDSLGRWLYGVSRKVAGRARAQAARRRRVEGAAVVDRAATPATDGRELAAALDEELGRLAEPFRSAIVLCDLGGLSHEEAARDLRCPVGTIKSRLARGRERLRGRLARRGFAPAVVILGAEAAASAALIDATVGAATRLAASGGTMPAEAVSAAAVALAEGAIQAMTITKIKMAGAAALMLGLAGSGAGVLAQQRGDGEATGPKPVAAPPAVSRANAATDPPRFRPAPAFIADLRRVREGIDHLLERQEKPDDPAVARARAEVAEAFDRIVKAVYALPDPAWPPVSPKSGAEPVASRNPPREFEKVSMPDYVVEPPDIIVVEVLQALPGRPITGERLVRPDGKISLGFYGEVHVASLTTAEVKAKVIEHLREYLNDEQLGLMRIDEKTGRPAIVAPAKSSSVFVDVTAYNSKVYYVQGDVGTPGRLPITGNETVLDAIQYAGGLVPSASPTKIRLVRPAKDSAPEKILEVDLLAIVERGESKTNYQIMPGDRLIASRPPATATAPVEPKAGAAPAAAEDLEARLREMERKLELILKRLEGSGKP